MMDVPGPVAVAGVRSNQSSMFLAAVWSTLRSAKERTLHSANKTQPDRQCMSLSSMFYISTAGLELCTVTNSKMPDPKIITTLWMTKNVPQDTTCIHLSGIHFPLLLVGLSCANALMHSRTDSWLLTVALALNVCCIHAFMWGHVQRVCAHMCGGQKLTSCIFISDLLY